MEQAPSDEDRHHPSEEWRDRRAADEAAWRLDRLGPLLRELIAWDLVYETESGGFLLREDVQRRLAEASARHARSATPEVYVGRTCQRCGATGVTRIVGGVRLCTPCSEAPPADESTAVAPAPRRHGRHDRASWRSRKAG